MKQVASIGVTELSEMAMNMYGDLVKADVDILKGVVVVDMDMHADGEAYLLENGSNQVDLWGINLHPNKYKTEEFVEFDSMINIRPRQKNLSRDVQDPQTREKIIQLIARVVHD